MRTLSLSWQISIAVYLLFCVCVFLYSFTQVDLSLTLSRASFWQDIQKHFQYIGYFDRPLSAQLFIVLLSFFYGFYFLFLRKNIHEKISSSTAFVFILLVTIILMFSYNAFSHDIFNYMFDAKIVTLYHQNPYMYKALDFPGDPYLSFMHWTHRVYPYGPVWLVFTVIFSFIGMQYFLLTFFLFKLLMAAGFLCTVYFIRKILQLKEKGQEVYSMFFFALSPIVIVESLISAHNDSVMMGLALASVYLILKKKYTFSYTLLLLSIGIKFATVFLVPVYILEFILRMKRKPLSLDTFFHFCLFFMSLSIIAVTMRSNFQPWYLLYIMPFGALLAHKFYISIPLTILSYAALLTYLPFLISGNWDPPIPSILSGTMYVALLLSIVVTSLWVFIRKII